MAGGGRTARQLLRVGAHEVDVERRIVTTLATGRIARLTLKALQVLLVLCEAEGRVVSREALMARVWKDRCPTDDVLTQAIALLRRTFRDAPGSPVYVETIAKGGYRLVVPHAWVGAPAPFPAAAVVAASDAAEDAAAAAGAPAAPQAGGAEVAANATNAANAANAANAGEAGLAAGVVAPACAADTRDSAPVEPQAPAAMPQRPLPAVAPVAALAAARPRWRHAAAFAVALPLALCAGLAGYLLSPRAAEADTGPAPLPLQYQAIAASSAPERNPALSPDGSHVAYSRDTGEAEAVFVQVSSSNGAHRVTTPPAGARDQRPVWSPDGRKLAFIRQSEDACLVMVIASTGGAEREVGRCDQGHDAFDWTPDGLGLVMGGRGVAPGQGAALHRLDLRSGRWQALDYPRAPADVDSMPRYSPDGRWLAFVRGTSLGDLWLMPAAGGALRRLTRLQGDIRGWDWLPDSRGLVLSLVRDEAQLYQLDLEDLSLRPFSAPGRGNPLNPDVAARAWTMVFELDRFRGGLFRRDLGDESAPAEPLFPSSGVDVLPAVSPDGTRVAFVSDRSLETGLWVGEPEHPETLRRIGNIVPVPRHAPVWSADGRRLLLVATGPAGDRLLEVEVDSGEVKVLPVPQPKPVYAAYTGRADEMLVGVDGGHGRLRLVLYKLPEWKPVAQLEDVSLARHDPSRDRICFTRASRAGLWCAAPDLTQVVQVSERLPSPDHYRDWLLADGQVLLLSPGVRCQVHVVVPGQPKSGRCLHAGQALVPGSLVLDGDGRHAYLSLAVDQNVDVGMAGLDSLQPATAVAQAE